MRWILPVVMLLLVVGCAESGSDEPPPEPDVKPGEGETVYTHEIGVDTEGSLTGPQQAMPPNGTIPAGTKAKVLHDAGSYSRIVTETGVNGYVSTSALKKLP